MHICRVRKCGSDLLFRSYFLIFEQYRMRRGMAGYQKPGFYICLCPRLFIYLFPKRRSMITLSLLIATYNRAARLIGHARIGRGAGCAGRAMGVCRGEQQLDRRHGCALHRLCGRAPAVQPAYGRGAQSGPVVCAQPRHTREYGRIYSHHRRRRNVSPRPSSRPISHSSIRFPRLLRAEGPSCRYIRRDVRRGCRVSRSDP